MSLSKCGTGMLMRVYQTFRIKWNVLHVIHSMIAMMIEISSSTEQKKLLNGHDYNVRSSSIVDQYIIYEKNEKKEKKQLSLFNSTYAKSNMCALVRASKSAAASLFFFLLFLSFCLLCKLRKGKSSLFESLPNGK